MKPERIIIDSNDEYTHGIWDASDSQTVNDTIYQRSNHKVFLTDKYRSKNLSNKSSMDLNKFLEQPQKLRVSKITIPTLPSFNKTNNVLRMYKAHSTDTLQDQYFNIEMPTDEVYLTYNDFNIRFQQLLHQYGSSNWTSAVSQNGILTITNNDPVFEPLVIERNLKFGFITPSFTISNVITSGKSVELNQTNKIYLRSNFETNVYSSDGDTKTICIVPFDQDIKTISAGHFTYVNPSDTFIAIQPANYDQIIVEYLDDFKNPMNFNSESFAIELEFLY